VHAAEAKKMEDARDDTRLNPRPPLHTGRLACCHWSSVSDMLQILQTYDLIWASNLSRSSWSTLHTARNVWSGFGVLKNSSGERGHRGLIWA